MLPYSKVFNRIYSNTVSLPLVLVSECSDDRNLAADEGKHTRVSRNTQSRTSQMQNAVSKKVMLRR